MSEINPNSVFVPDYWMSHLKERFDGGEQWALMQAIEVCARKRWTLPDWAALAYISAFEKIQSAEAETWDEVFGRACKEKYTHFNALSKRKKLSWQVYMYAQELLEVEPKTRIDNEFFERVGQKFNIGRTLASEYYYEAKNFMHPK